MTSRKYARAAQQRLLKRVKLFTEKFKVPTVVMTMHKGQIVIEGSAGMESFGANKLVRDAFIKASQLVDPVGPDIDGNDTDPQDLIQILGDLPNLSVAVLRCIISKAAFPDGLPGRAGSYYEGDGRIGRPCWWPTDIPFTSPNHPSSNSRPLYRRDLLRIATSLANYMGIDEQEDEGDEMDDPPEPALLPADEARALLLGLETSAADGGWESFRDAVAHLPEIALPMRQLPRVEEHRIDQRFHSRLYLLNGQRVYPAICTGDGNCLFNAISVLLYGREDYNLHLRLATVKASVDRLEDIVQLLCRDYPTTDDAFAYATEVLNDTDPFPEAGEPLSILGHTSKAGIMATAKNFSYSGLLQITLVANAIRSPIKVFVDNEYELVARVAGAGIDPTMAILWCKATENSRQLSHFEPMMAFPEESSEHQKKPFRNRVLDKCSASSYGMCSLKLWQEENIIVPWMQCSSCQQWYHAPCVGLPTGLFTDDDPFCCCGTGTADNPDKTLGTLILLGGSHVEIKLSDVLSTKLSRDLTDSVINFYIRTLQDASGEDVELFYTHMRLNEVDISSRRILVFPVKSRDEWLCIAFVHYDDARWTCIVMDHKNSESHQDTAVQLWGWMRERLGEGLPQLPDFMHPMVTTQHWHKDSALTMLQDMDIFSTSSPEELSNTELVKAKYKWTSVRRMRCKINHLLYQALLNSQ